MADISIGVIGTGGMGTRHAMNLHWHVAGARVAAVYDLDSARAGQTAAACGDAQVFHDPMQLIQDSGIDAVVIASPDSTHAEFVRACLQHHKAVLCEKPLATTTEAALGIVEAEQAAGRRLIALGFMRRFDPQHVAVKQVVESKVIGRPILFKGASRNPMIPPHLPVDVIITNSVVHDLDSARWLLGQEIQEVYVRGVRTRPSFSDQTLDLLLIHMSLSGPCLATVEASLAVEYGYEITAEIVGELGTTETMQPDTASVRFQQQRRLPVPQDWLVRFQAAYVAELQDWVRSLHASQPFGGASAWDGYMAALAAEACLQSLRSGAPASVPTPIRSELYQP
jgi:myo-inositol 2-dehydrogenase/D-chiro-inositol 1-dehydrogenase